MLLLLYRLAAVLQRNPCWLLACPWLAGLVLYHACLQAQMVIHVLAGAKVTPKACKSVSGGLPTET